MMNGEMRQFRGLPLAELDAYRTPVESARAQRLLPPPVLQRRSYSIQYSLKCRGRLILRRFLKPVSDPMLLVFFSSLQSGQLFHTHIYE